MDETDSTMRKRPRRQKTFNPGASDEEGDHQPVGSCSGGGQHQQTPPNNHDGQQQQQQHQVGATLQAWNEQRNDGRLLYVTKASEESAEEHRSTNRGLLRPLHHGVRSTSCSRLPDHVSVVSHESGALNTTLSPESMMMRSGGGDYTQDRFRSRADGKRRQMYAPRQQPRYSEHGYPHDDVRGYRGRTMYDENAPRSHGGVGPCFEFGRKKSSLDVHLLVMPAQSHERNPLVEELFIPSFVYTAIPCPSENVANTRDLEELARTVVSMAAEWRSGLYIRLEFLDAQDLHNQTLGPVTIVVGCPQELQQDKPPVGEYNEGAVVHIRSGPCQGKKGIVKRVRDSNVLLQVLVDGTLATRWEWRKHVELMDPKQVLEKVEGLETSQPREKSLFSILGSPYEKPITRRKVSREHPQSVAPPPPPPPPPPNYGWNHLSHPPKNFRPANQCTNQSYRWADKLSPQLQAWLNPREQAGESKGHNVPPTYDPTRDSGMMHAAGEARMATDKPVAFPSVITFGGSMQNRVRSGNSEQDSNDRYMAQEEANAGDSKEEGLQPREEAKTRIPSPSQGPPKKRSLKASADPNETADRDGESPPFASENNEQHEQSKSSPMET